MRIESDQSFAKRVGLRELRADVLVGEQVRFQVPAFKVESRLNEESQLTGRVIERLLRKIAEVAIGSSQIRGVIAGRNGLVLYQCIFNVS